MVIPRRSLLILLVWLVLAGGCTRLPSLGITTLKPKSFGELQSHLLGQREPDPDLFRLRGPFTVIIHEDQQIQLSRTERVDVDVYLSSHEDSGPLVIFMHGYGASKRAHAYQAAHLASWGFNAISVQLPRRGPWTNNGRILARLARQLYASPQLIDARIDRTKIILVGHSFGASAVAIAVAEGAPVLGAVLLDPAAIGSDLPKFLLRVRKPVMVLGADEELSTARNRALFYEYIRGAIAEVSIKDAAHEDAQYPSQDALDNFGYDAHTTEEAQISFVSALTSAVLSLAATGGLEYAWANFRPLLESGKLIDAKKK